jgi:hypothetical protein
MSQFWFCHLGNITKKKDVLFGLCLYKILCGIKKYSMVRLMPQASHGNSFVTIFARHTL